MKKRLFLSLTMSLVALQISSSGVWALPATPTTIDELRADKLASFYKKDARAQDLMTKAQAFLDKQKQSSPDSPQTKRLQSELDKIAFTAGSDADTRLRLDLDFLEAVGKDHKSPGADELSPLQERYKKLCDKIDDLIFSKDLDRLAHAHDKFVRYTAVGLWDKDKIASELERMEGLVERAGDIPYGRSQLLDSCKNKRLAHVQKLVYLGTSSREEMYLTTDRRSIALIDEAGGRPLELELAEHIIQDSDGKLVNLTDCNNSSMGLPFSPPLTLWAKSRILDGRLPAILLRLGDDDARIDLKNATGKEAKGEFHNVAAVASGKLDDYIKANASQLGPDKTPVLLGLLSDFDREAAGNSFGADGKTPYYSIMDPKLKDLSGDKLQEELKKKLEKGAFVSAKTLPAELSNQYGDAQVPDGPERVRDAWKRLSKVVTESGGSSISLFSSAGAFHANKNAGKYPGEQNAGNQAWNKLEYYWPGEGILDWVGINAVGLDPAVDPKGANLMESLEPFMAEVRTSSWQSTPVMLTNLSPSRTQAPFQEASWIQTVYTKMIPATFPNILAVFVSIPNTVTLWSRDASASFRNNVSSAKAYSYKMRFKSLDKPGT